MAGRWLRKEKKKSIPGRLFLLERARSQVINIKAHWGESNAFQSIFFKLTISMPMHFVPEMILLVYLNPFNILTVEEYCSLN